MDKKQAEKEYLRKTLDIIESQLEQLGESQKRRSADLFEAQKYMWEELPGTIRSESDWYDISSQNDLIISSQKNVDATRAQAELLKRLLSSPYFGRVDFRPDSGDPFTAYIGTATIMDKSTFTARVCDWRAPVASLFYENGRGRTFFESPDGSCPGEVTLLRQYRIENGELLLMLDSEVRIDDTLLMNALSADSSEHMKTIVSTIQREQNTVIRDAKNDMLVVLGPAGSGKTSIALHRIAYLLYRDRDKLKSRNILIFSPNDIFLKYISQVIPTLGESEVPQTTFCDLIKKFCGFETEGLYSQLEFIASGNASRAARIRRKWLSVKGSMDFALLARSFAAKYTPDFSDIVFNGETVMSAAEMRALYSKNRGTDVLTRLSHLQSVLTDRLAPHKKRYREEISKELDCISGSSAQSAETRRAFDEAAADTLAEISRCLSVDWPALYTRFLRYAAKKLVSSDRLRAELLSDADRAMQRSPLFYEDGVGLLLLKASFGAIPRQTSIRHVVIDEVQDYSPAQHEIFRLLFCHCRFTVLGDLLQLINSGLGADSEKKILGIYGFKRSEIRLLSKSYRSTVEIASVSASVLLNPPEYEVFDRHGPPVRFICEKDENSLLSRIEDELLRFDRDGSSTALLCRTAGECRRLCRKLKPKLPNIHPVCSDSDTYRHGLVAMPLALAKGLEFDRVVIPDSSLYKSESDRNLLYVACSRAMHELSICSVGAPSPLFPDGVTEKGE